MFKRSFLAVVLFLIVVGLARDVYSQVADEVLRGRFPIGYLDRWGVTRSLQELLARHDIFLLVDTVGGEVHYLFGSRWYPAQMVAVSENSSPTKTSPAPMAPLPAPEPDDSTAGCDCPTGFCPCGPRGQCWERFAHVCGCFCSMPPSPGGNQLTGVEKSMAIANLVGYMIGYAVTTAKLE